jgi:hypothetical protein
MSGVLRRTKASEREEEDGRRKRGRAGMLSGVGAEALMGEFLVLERKCHEEGMQMVLMSGDLARR